MNAPAVAATRAVGDARHTRKGRQEHRRRVQIWTRVIAAGVCVAGIAVVAAVVASSKPDPPAAVVPVDMHLELGDYYIAGDLEVAAGDIRLEAVNVGVVPHNVGIRRGPITTNLVTGKRATLDLGNLAPGTYELYCDIVGHVELGMVAPLVVTAAVPTS